MMNLFQVKSTSEPMRCEICHQNDQFDAANNHCSRCATIKLHQPSRLKLLWKNFTQPNSKSPRNHHALIIKILVVIGIVKLLGLSPLIFNYLVWLEKGVPVGASAIEAMRLFHSTQATYRSGIGKGQFTTATELFRNDFIDPTLARAAGVPLGTTSIWDQKVTQGEMYKSGYYFRVFPIAPTKDKPARFFAVAISGKDSFGRPYGKRNFYVDETGIIRCSNNVNDIPDANSTPLNN